MSMTEIEVRFADPPKDGKKLGTIKTADGTMYGVWPNKLGLFQPGQKYEVEFSERQWNGKTYRTIGKFKPKGTTGASTHSPQPAVQNHTETAEQKFVAAVLCAAVQNQMVEMNDRSLKEAINAIRHAWGQTFGSFSGKV